MSAPGVKMQNSDLCYSGKGVGANV
jgi:hypothetical protein